MKNCACVDDVRRYVIVENAQLIRHFVIRFQFDKKRMVALFWNAIPVKDPAFFDCTYCSRLDIGNCKITNIRAAPFRR